MLTPRPSRRPIGEAVWVTDEYEHNGLRARGEEVLGHLLDLPEGR
jgi:hypothetical protein